MLLSPRLSVVVLSSLLVICFAGTAMAESNWARNHPRRHEVNQRLANQNRRITNEVRRGEITRGQAHQLRRQDRQIRKEERAMAAQHGGHITRAQQKALNQQENGVSRQIGR